MHERLPNRSGPWARLGGLVLAGLLAAPAQAVQIQVLALFPGKALVSIDGKRRVLSAGQRSPEGVLLVSADPREAVLESEGRRETLGLVTTVGGVFAKPVATEARILRDNDGSYTTVGTVNGLPVGFIVDTGASAVMLSGSQAERLGLQYRLEGDRVGVKTASGATLGYAVRLDSVRVGDIVLRGVRAVVIRGAYPQKALLGMTFLDRVHIENRDGLMILRAKLQ